MTCRIPKIVVLLLSLGVVGCAAPRRYASIEDIPPSPNLPKAEQVALMGQMAAQRWIALNPKVADVIVKADFNTVTASWVETNSKLPVEWVIRDPKYLEITLYALAHQWGLVQLSLDYVLRHEKLVESHRESARSRQAAAGLSNFFLALSSMGYSLSSAYSRSPTERLSNQLAISQNQQSADLNRLLVESHQERIENLGGLILRVRRIKAQLQAYSNFLEIQRDLLLQAVKEARPPAPSEPLKILEAKVVF